MGGFQLSVDFGTSSTVAVLAGPDGTRTPLLFDGEEFLPSAACLDNAPHLLVGRDALDLGQTHPDRLAAHPKAAVDRGAVVLGGVECPVGDLFAAVFARVAAEARRVAGEPMTTVTLTHPACWDRRRQATLTRAAAKVGLGPTRLVAEPVAAARHAVDSDLMSVPEGASLVVYDLGAGTFDTAVLRHTGETFEVLAQRGLPDIGGLALDDALVAHLGALLADDTIRWERLTRPGTPADSVASRRFLDELRAAKELLSRADATVVHVPLFEEDVTLDRADLETLARPMLETTVAATVAALAEAGVTPAGLAGVLLVGGSSRIPLVSALLREALEVEPTAIRRPKMAFAEGCLPVRPPQRRNRPKAAQPTTGPASTAPGPARTAAPASGTSSAGPEPATAAGPSASPSGAAQTAPIHDDAVEGEPITPEPAEAPAGFAAASFRSAAAAEEEAAEDAAARRAPVRRPAAWMYRFRPRWQRYRTRTAPPYTQPPPYRKAPPYTDAPPSTQAPWSGTVTSHRRRNRGRPKVNGRAMRVVAGTMAAAAVVAIVAGVWGTLTVLPGRQSGPATIEVGQCIRQDGAGAVQVDCAEPGAYTVVSRVYPAGACPDPGQPYAMQGATQLCLSPNEVSAVIGPRSAP